MPWLIHLRLVALLLLGAGLAVACTAQTPPQAPLASRLGVLDAREAAQLGSGDAGGRIVRQAAPDPLQGQRTVDISYVVITGLRAPGGFLESRDDALRGQIAQRLRRLGLAAVSAQPVREYFGPPRPGGRRPRLLSTPGVAVPVTQSRVGLATILSAYEGVGGAARLEMILAVYDRAQAPVLTPDQVDLAHLRDLLPAVRWLEVVRFRPPRMVDLHRTVYSLDLTTLDTLLGQAFAEFPRPS